MNRAVAGETTMKNGAVAFEHVNQNDFKQPSFASVVSGAPYPFSQILTDRRGIETPLKIDNTTLLGNFGHYTRVLVDMDLSGFVRRTLLETMMIDEVAIGKAPKIGSHGKGKEIKTLGLTQMYKPKQVLHLYLQSTTPSVPTTNAFEYIESVWTPSYHSMVPRHITLWADAFGDSEDVHDDYADERVVNEWPPLHGQRASKPLKKFDGMPNVGHQSNIMAIILVMLDSFGTLNAAQQNLNLVASQPLVFEIIDHNL
ncbi:hypothetical protein FNV43_RR26716 [Rhamnella rubrinervis]|uniref:Uncharacterized protein n=1 Tax=Rhamnella rubrinervis TaxID=2594499 RepID=A0A8K0GRT3_9ROSA|nr:hypothetical protein FNV43_RR26716 [Rhamnella rubrinervis]